MRAALTLLCMAVAVVGKKQEEALNKDTTPFWLRDQFDGKCVFFFFRFHTALVDVAGAAFQQRLQYQQFARPMHMHGSNSGVDRRRRTAPVSGYATVPWLFFGRRRCCVPQHWLYSCVTPVGKPYRMISSMMGSCGAASEWSHGRPTLSKAAVQSTEGKAKPFIDMQSHSYLLRLAAPTPRVQCC